MGGVAATAAPLGGPRKVFAGHTRKYAANDHDGSRDGCRSAPRSSQPWAPRPADDHRATGLALLGMSKHIFYSVHDGQNVIVEMGWDQPLRHYFMQITKVEVAPQTHVRDAPYVYNNLSDIALDGGAEDPVYYWTKLHELGIDCPFSFEIGIELQLDAASGGSNRIVRYGLQSN